MNDSVTSDLVSKLPNVGESIFTRMSQLATEQGALNLSQGFPDFEVDPVLVERIHHAMKSGANQYAPSNGLPVLRKNIALRFQEYLGASIDDHQITVTAGATEGLYAAISAIVSKGDEVIVFDPAYDSYDPVIRLNGGIPIHINLKGDRFSIDWKEVTEKMSLRTRAIIINTPHNPTGSILDASDLKSLETLALKHA